MALLSVRRRFRLLGRSTNAYVKAAMQVRRNNTPPTVLPRTAESIEPLLPSLPPKAPEIGAAEGETVDVLEDETLALTLPNADAKGPFDLLEEAVRKGAIDRVAVTLEDTRTAVRDADRVTAKDRLALARVRVAHRLCDGDEEGERVDNEDGDRIEADPDALPDPEVDADGLALLDADELCDSVIGRVSAWLHVLSWLRD